MLRLVRVALQVLLFFMLLSVVVGVGSDATGAVEKAVLVAIAVLMVWAASAVRRIGRPGAALG